VSRPGPIIVNQASTENSLLHHGYGRQFASCCASLSLCTSITDYIRERVMYIRVMYIRESCGTAQLAQITNWPHHGGARTEPPGLHVHQTKPPRRANGKHIQTTLATTQLGILLAKFVTGKICCRLTVRKRYMLQCNAVTSQTIAINVRGAPNASHHALIPRAYMFARQQTLKPEQPKVRMQESTTPR
jgi:hypothetical protein